MGAPATRTGRGTLRRGGELGDEVPRTERERTIERTAGLWAGTAWAWRCLKPVEEVTGKGAATMAAPSGERGESALQRVAFWGEVPSGNETHRVRRRPVLGAE